MEAFTVSAHRACTTSSTSAASDRLAWAGERATTHHKITVVPRADRKPLIPMLEQGSQVCQVHLDCFPGDEKSQKHEAFQLMKEIAMAYSSDSVKKGDLPGMRDDRLARLGLLKPKRGRVAAAKRPAATARPEEQQEQEQEQEEEEEEDDCSGKAEERDTAAAVKRKPAAAVEGKPAAASAEEKLTH